MKIKQLKIINQDQSTEIADIGADAINVDYNDTTVKAELDKLNDDNDINKTNIANLQSGLNTTNSNLASQTSRIDNLAHLEEGSTTGDAELIDARTSFDGTIYNNVGNAIRNSVTIVNNEIKNNEELANEKFDIGDYVFIEDITFTYGKYLKRNGSEQSYDGDAYVSSYVQVFPNETLKIYATSAAQACFYVFFDINKNVISYYPIEEKNETLDWEIITVPKNAYFIKTSTVYQKQKPYIMRKKNNKMVNNLTEKIDNNTYLINHIIESKGTYINITENFELINAFIYDSGAVSMTDDGQLTDYLLVDELDELYITARAQYSTKILVVFDKNKRALLSLGTNEYFTKYKLNKDIIYNWNVNAYYIRICSYNAPLVIESYIRKTTEELYNEIWNELDTKAVYNTDLVTFKAINDIIGVTNGYLDTGGKYHPLESCQTSNYIKLTDYPTLYICGSTADALGTNAFYCLYDSNKNFVSSEAGTVTHISMQNYELSLSTIAENNPTAVYIRIVSYYANLIMNAYVTPNLTEVLDIVTNQNVLYGKKYVSCGDSFTAGTFGSRSDETLYDKTYQSFKTYSYWIAKRNNMKFINEAQSGSTMYNNGSNNAFSVTRYTQIPLDTDYITLMFGLNETNAPIGNITDNTNETIYGAWNIVLEYLITNLPFAKIGIILSDAWLSAALHEAMINIAERWGIPYLDLRATNVPMGISGRGDNKVCQKAKELRNNAFQMSVSDSHPNPAAHKYRSTIVENWLRSL